ncbi:MAG: hypothetical protein ACLP9L_09235 [Thermoguttaceae bacterium]
MTIVVDGVVFSTAIRCRSAFLISTASQLHGKATITTNISNDLTLNWSRRRKINATPNHTNIASTTTPTAATATSTGQSLGSHRNHCDRNSRDSTTGTAARQ